MAIIKVPQPPKSAMDPDRPISTLLKSQIRHLQEAEFRLPVRAQTNIYINTIKTEGQAADYIRRVTKTLHEQHAAALKPARKAKEKPKVGPKFAIAAVGRSKPAAKSKRKRATKSRKGKS
jgi:hypothetical protein